MNGDVEMHNAKIVGTRKCLSNTIKDTSTIMRNPPYIRIFRQRVVLASLILFLRGLSCSHYFLHGASLHHHRFS